MFDISSGSLREHTTPAWLREAKFGIYTHWGPYSVPACGPNTTWYSNHLYKQQKAELKYHRQHFGPLEKFGYTDFFPLFTAEKFDAGEWAETFANAGAKFAGPVGEHHDGFSMWKTDLNEFNSFNTGPKRDIVGELEKAYRAQGMKYMVALHHAENYWFLERVPGTDSVNPKFEAIFSKVGIWPREKFVKLWYAKTIEIIDKYSPDLLWFDFGLKEIPDIYKRTLLQYYYNDAIAKNKEVAVTYKYHDLPAGMGMIDLELGRYNQVQYNEWITDSTVDDGQAWGYMNGAKYKTPARVIHYLIDNVSKNGYLLLNVGPKADGTFPEEAKEILSETGKWLKVNGEAIYGTSPWYTAGEGPVEMKKSGSFTEEEELKYTGKDIRYTAKDNSLYAILLGWPGKEAVLNSVMPYFAEGELESIELLGCDKKLNFKIDGLAVKVEMPGVKPCEHAYTLKINRKTKGIISPNN